MIIDRFINLKNYTQRDWLLQVLDFHSTISVDSKNGEYELFGQQLYAKLLDYNTKTSNFIVESHRKYVDIQVVIEGEEYINIYDIENSELNVKMNYNENNDCIFYADPIVEPLAKVLLKPGDMGIFFPNDVHMAQIRSSNNIRFLKKVVFKVAIEFF